MSFAKISPVGKPAKAHKKATPKPAARKAPARQARQRPVGGR